MSTLQNIMQAILNLNPTAKVGAFTSIDDITWHVGTPIISKSDIEAEVSRIETEYDAQAYARNRQTEYPSVQECVHAILDDELTALQEKRQAVKTKYPKS